MKKLVLFLLFISSTMLFAQIEEMKIHFKDNTEQSIKMLDIQQINFVNPDATNYKLIIHKKDNTSEEYSVESIGEITFSPATLDIDMYVHYNGDGSVETFSTKDLTMQFYTTDPGSVEYDAMPGVMSFTSVTPNPFNNTTTVEFEIEKPGDAEFIILDEKGTQVKKFEGQYLETGAHSIVWNGLDNGGSQVSSGMYFFIVKVGESAIAKKIVYVK